MLILIRYHADVLCCPTVIMDMSGVVTETAGLPSGSIPPLSPEAAARVKTTSTAPGEDCVIDKEFISILYDVIYIHVHCMCMFWRLSLGC